MKTEPGARSEASLPPELEIRDWATLLGEDPVNLLGPYAGWSSALYRLHLVMRGRMPRYAEFMPDAAELGRGLVPDDEGSQRDFDTRLRALASGAARGAEFRALYGGLDDAQYAARLYENAGLAAEPGEREALASALASGAMTRADALLRLAHDPRLVERERNRSLLLLHYFGFLRRNPDDRPDSNMSSYDFWRAKLNSFGGDYIAAQMVQAFITSGEYRARFPQQ